MDAALFVSDESKSQLDAGVAIKLRAAGTARLSQVPLPTATEGITGVKWKRLARDAELSAAEMGDLGGALRRQGRRSSFGDFSAACPTSAPSPRSLAWAEF